MGWNRIRENINYLCGLRELIIFTERGTWTGYKLEMKDNGGGEGSEVLSRGWVWMERWSCEHRGNFNPITQCLSQWMHSVNAVSSVMTTAGLCTDITRNSNSLKNVWTLGQDKDIHSSPQHSGHPAPIKLWQESPLVSRSATAESLLSLLPAELGWSVPQWPESLAWTVDTLTSSPWNWAASVERWAACSWKYPLFRLHWQLLTDYIRGVQSFGVVCWATLIAHIRCMLSAGSR